MGLCKRPFDRNQAYAGQAVCISRICDHQLTILSRELHAEADTSLLSCAGLLQQAVLSGCLRQDALQQGQSSCC